MVCAIDGNLQGYPNALPSWSEDAIQDHHQMQHKLAIPINIGPSILDLLQLLLV